MTVFTIIFICLILYLIYDYTCCSKGLVLYIGTTSLSILKKCDHIEKSYRSSVYLIRPALQQLFVHLFYFYLDSKKQWLQEHISKKIEREKEKNRTELHPILRSCKFIKTYVRDHTRRFFFYLIEQTNLFENIEYQNDINTREILNNNHFGTIILDYYLPNIAIPKKKLTDKKRMDSSYIDLYDLISVNQQNKTKLIMIDKNWRNILNLEHTEDAQVHNLYLQDSVLIQYLRFSNLFNSSESTKHVKRGKTHLKQVVREHKEICKETIGNEISTSKEEIDNTEKEKVINQKRNIKDKMNAYLNRLEYRNIKGIIVVVPEALYNYVQIDKIKTKAPVFYALTRDVKIDSFTMIAKLLGYICVHIHVNMNFGCCIPFVFKIKKLNLLDICTKEPCEKEEEMKSNIDSFPKNKEGNETRNSLQQNTIKQHENAKELEKEEEKMKEEDSLEKQNILEKNKETDVMNSINNKRKNSFESSTSLGLEDEYYVPLFSSPFSFFCDNYNDLNIAMNHLEHIFKNYSFVFLSFNDGTNRLLHYFLEKVNKKIKQKQKKNTPIDKSTNFQNKTQMNKYRLHKMKENANTKKKPIMEGNEEIQVQENIQSNKGNLIDKFFKDRPIRRKNKKKETVHRLCNSEPKEEKMKNTDESNEEERKELVELKNERTRNELGNEREPTLDSVLGSDEKGLTRFNEIVEEKEVEEDLHELVDYPISEEIASEESEMEEGSDSEVKEEINQTNTQNDIMSTSEANNECVTDATNKQKHDKKQKNGKRKIKKGYKKELLKRKQKYKGKDSFLKLSKLNHIFSKTVNGKEPNEKGEDIMEHTNRNKTNFFKMSNYHRKKALREENVSITLKVKNHINKFIINNEKVKNVAANCNKGFEFPKKHFLFDKLENYKHVAMLIDEHKKNHFLEEEEEDEGENDKENEHSKKSRLHDVKEVKVNDAKNLSRKSATIEPGTTISNKVRKSLLKIKKKLKQNRNDDSDEQESTTHKQNLEFEAVMHKSIAKGKTNIKVQESMDKTEGNHEEHKKIESNKICILINFSYNNVLDLLNYNSDEEDVKEMDVYKMRKFALIHKICNVVHFLSNFFPTIVKRRYFFSYTNDLAGSLKKILFSEFDKKYVEQVIEKEEPQWNGEVKDHSKHKYVIEEPNEIKNRNIRRKEHTYHNHEKWKDQKVNEEEPDESVIKTESSLQKITINSEEKKVIKKFKDTSHDFTNSVQHKNSYYTVGVKSDPSQNTHCTYDSSSNVSNVNKSNFNHLSSFTDSVSNISVNHVQDTNRKHTTDEEANTNPNHVSKESTEQRKENQCIDDYTNALLHTHYDEMETKKKTNQIHKAEAQSSDCKISDKNKCVFVETIHKISRLQEEEQEKNPNERIPEDTNDNYTKEEMINTQDTIIEGTKNVKFAWNKHKVYTNWSEYFDKTHQKNSQNMFLWHLSFLFNVYNYLIFLYKCTYHNLDNYYTFCDISRIHQFFKEIQILKKKKRSIYDNKATSYKSSVPNFIESKDCKLFKIFFFLMQDNSNKFISKYMEHFNFPIVLIFCADAKNFTYRQFDIAKISKNHNIIYILFKKGNEGLFLAGWRPFIWIHKIIFDFAETMFSSALVGPKTN